MHTYEPAQLEDMTLVEAIDAVVADLLDHPVAASPHGVFTVMRHIDLLCHLTARAVGDAHFGLVYDHADPADQARVEPLSRAAAHFGRATAHYTLALAPVLALSKPDLRSTRHHQLDALDAHSRLTRHVHDALHALSDARTCLVTPHPASVQAAPAVSPPVPALPASKARH
ncbi:hypothetical protein [Streptomyces sp. PBH53]|uniref:hypothetical protein n=1 Tax=Streptomyces sp. PBH53 TaxID=1577075 RepID=UPI000B06C7F6|nr:hypothetical protein [Streptomyces sp. PBH53]